MTCFDTLQKHVNALALVNLRGFLQIFTLFIIAVSDSTIDVNLPELQHVADHLQPQECRRLVAALHFHSYDLPSALDEAELRVSREVSCIRLLLHWNSEPGEGKGASHEALEHRLRQLGHHDLADWLGKTVFHELGKDLERSMDNPFQDLLTDRPRRHKYGFQLEETKEKLDPAEWIAFDTISYAASALLAFLIIILCLKVVCMWTCKRTKSRRNKKYAKLEEFDDYSSDESEDKFDVRRSKLAAV